MRRPLGRLISWLGALLLLGGFGVYVAIQIGGSGRFPLRLDVVTALMLTGLALIPVGLFLRGKQPPFTEEQSAEARRSWREGKEKP